MARILLPDTFQPIAALLFVVFVLMFPKLEAYRRIDQHKDSKTKFDIHKIIINTLSVVIDKINHSMPVVDWTP